MSVYETMIAVRRQGAPLAAVLALVACSTSATAGRLKHTVSPADLAQVDVASLDELQDVEHAWMMAETALGAMDVKIEDARAEVDGANQEIAATRADIAAARAEKTAARKNLDSERMDVAVGKMTTAKSDLQTDQDRLRWARLNLDARKAELVQATTTYELAQAEMELARIQLMEDLGVPASDNYSTADFYGQVTDSRRTLRKATEQAMRKDQKAQEASRETWDVRPPPES